MAPRHRTRVDMSVVLWGLLLFVLVLLVALGVMTALSAVAVWVFS